MDCLLNISMGYGKDIFEQGFLWLVLIIWHCYQMFPKDLTKTSWKIRVIGVQLKCNFCCNNFSFHFLNKQFTTKIIFRVKYKKFLNNLKIKNLKQQTMSNQSIEQKQQYLRVNIIDAGYDAEQFVEYCTNQHSLDDLADWSLQKLARVVQIFINTKAQNQNNQNKKKKQQKKFEDDWSSFDTSSPVKSFQYLNNYQKVVSPAIIKQKSIQNEGHHNMSKTGHLIFSQADWGIFLGGTGSSQLKTVELQQPQIPTNNINLKPVNNYLQLNSPGQKNIEKKQISQVKDSKKISDSSKKIDTSKKINQQSPKIQTKDNPLSISVSFVQNNSFKGENRGPINFSNVKLVTAKVNPMPKLILINDIFISKTEQISRNFLKSDFTQYHIHFKPGNHTIQRKFSDLRKLRGLLQKLYPHIRMPYLEPEGWLTSSEGKDSQTLAKYKWMIIDFIKYIIIRNQQLKNCSLVRKFCGYSIYNKPNQQTELVSKDELKKMFESFQNYPKLSQIKQIPISKGLVILPPSENGEKYMHNTLTVMQQIDYEYEKLRKKFETLFYYYDLLGKSMSDVSTLFQTLQNLIKKYNFQNNQSTQFRVYDGIKQTCNKMRNTINDQFVLFKSRVKNIFRYQKDNMMTLKEIFQQKNIIHNEYIKQGYPILSNSAQSLNGEVEIDSNISLDEPCRTNKNILCVQEIFWSHFVKEQIKNYWAQLRCKINEQLTIIAYEQLDNQNDNLNFWNSMIKKSVI